MLNKLILFLCFLGITHSQNSPVFLWGSSSTPFKPALKSLSGNDFSEIISSNLEDSMLLVFLEENLQTQDFSQCKLESGETCFSNLKTYKTKTFYADVEDPVTHIKKLSNDNEIEILQITNDGKLPENIKYEVGKIVLVSFNDKIEERSQALIEHDSIMANIYKLFENEGNILALFTSQENLEQSNNRVRRQAKAADSKPWYGSDQNIGVLVYASQVSYIEDNKPAENIDLSGVTVKKTSSSAKPDEAQITIATTKGDAVFNIKFNKGYWSANNLKFNEKDFKLNIESSVAFSYYCGDIVSTSGNNKLIFTDLQMEAIFDHKDNDKAMQKFSDPWHCTGFISGGIISGLFVTFMFVIIMAIGISWLMDIRTMDRFDDPKGKTITINVSE